MKVWISKYALTTGIILVDGEQCEQNLSMCRYKRSDEHLTEYAHGEGKEWHRTEASAIKQANILKERKISSLKKQLAKLESIQFKQNTL